MAGFKYLVIFTPDAWENDEQFDKHIFSDGLVKNHQLLVETKSTTWPVFYAAKENKHLQRLPRHWGTWTKKTLKCSTTCCLGIKVYRWTTSQRFAKSKVKAAMPCAPKRHSPAPPPAVQLLTCFKFTCPGIMATTTPMATFWLSSWRRKDPNLEPELSTMCGFFGKKNWTWNLQTFMKLKGLVINWMMMNTNPL